MKITVYCDSGANAFSKREDTFSLEDLGLTKEEWDEMTDEEKEDFIKPIALDRFEWGFYEEK
jgi:hypothetical protein